MENHYDRKANLQCKCLIVFSYSSNHSSVLRTLKRNKSCTDDEDENLDDDYGYASTTEGDQDPKSDLSIEHHPHRKAGYELKIEGDSSDISEDDTASATGSPHDWIVGDTNISKECAQHADDCFAKRILHQLSDVSVLYVCLQLMTVNGY